MLFRTVRSPGGPGSRYRASAWVARLIDDCCRSDPKDRVADMPAVIERIDLARTILSSRTSEAEARDAEPHVEPISDHHEEVHAVGYDPVAVGLGLRPDGAKAIDFDDSTQGR